MSEGDALIWPLDLRPQEQSFYIQTRTVRFESPYTGQVQLQERPGARWVSDARFERSEGQARRLDALIAELAGPSGTVLLPDFRRLSPRGSRAGAPLLVGGQGTSLSLQGFDALSPGVLLAGDMVQTSLGRAHLVTQDVDADALGQAVAMIAPALRHPVETGPLQTQACRVRMRLVSDDAGENPTRANRISRYSLSFIEVLT